MKIFKNYVEVFDRDILNRTQKTFPINSFSRVAYFLELQSSKYGNQWIFTEFDSFSSDVEDYLIPSSKVIKLVVNNLSVKDSNGTNIEEFDNGHIKFTPFNYYPGENNYDTTDNLSISEGSYGCMQVHSGTNVLWAYNRHNDVVHDIGIGNNDGNIHKDWTFMANSKEYTLASLKVYAVKNEVSFDNYSGYNIDLTGVAHGDTLIFDHQRNILTQTRIPFNSSGHIEKPNFIIALAGQSNSQGYNAFYDENNPFDQSHERIFGFNSTTQSWEVADLNTESLGSFWHKAAGWQSLAFHFAKRLVEAYPDIRPGIINLGVGGQVIARWAKYPENHKWYQANVDRAGASGVLQGDIYDLHVEKINQALEQLPEEHKNIDVICWHQGESDGWGTDPNYYVDSINQVISQYRRLKYCNKKTPFIVGETTGAHVGTDQGWEARNVQLRNLNIDADPYTFCIDSADLETSNDQYNNGDELHFSATSQRKMGTRYFRAFRDMFSEV